MANLKSSKPFPFKLFLLSSLFGLSMGFTIDAFAQTADEISNAGITPDDPFWIFDVAGDNWNMFFTFEPNAKQQLGLEIASERLSEIGVTIGRGDIVSAKKAQIQHDLVLSHVEKSILEDTSNAKTEIELDEELEKKLMIEQKLEIHKLKIDEVKEKVRIILVANKDRLSANDKIEIDGVTKGLENAIVRIEIKLDNDKQEIKIRFADDFDKSSLEISKKFRDTNSDVTIKLSNSGKGSFSYGSGSDD